MIRWQKRNALTKFANFCSFVLITIVFFYLVMTKIFHFILSIDLILSFDSFLCLFELVNPSNKRKKKERSYRCIRVTIFQNMSFNQDFDKEMLIFRLERPAWTMKQWFNMRCCHSISYLLTQQLEFSSVKDVVVLYTSIHSFEANAMAKRSNDLFYLQVVYGKLSGHLKNSDFLEKIPFFNLL